MKTIYQYELPGPMMTLTRHLPANPHVARVALQDGKPYVWLFVDTEAPLQHVTFSVVGTGINVSDNALYVGTYDEDQFVWHVFVEILRD